MDWAREAFELVCRRLAPGAHILDVGAGSGQHTDAFRAVGHSVVPVDPAASGGGGFTYQEWHRRTRRSLLPEEEPVLFDCVWCSHTLEHQTDPGEFLRMMRADLRPGGLLAVTVPPLKHEIVGGHVTLWNAGLLLYQCVLAGFDCREAAVRTEGYNVSVVVPRVDACLPALRRDAGDIDRLAHLFPEALGVAEGFDGRIASVNWR